MKTNRLVENAKKWSPKQNDRLGAEKRLFLDYLLAHCKGIQNARSIERIIGSEEAFANFTKSAFQHNIIVPLRREPNLFVGMCHRGIYLITNAEDAEATAGFYVKRIASEKRHLRNLRHIIGRYHLPGTGPIPQRNVSHHVYFDESGTPAIGNPADRFFIVTAVIVEPKELGKIRAKFRFVREYLGKPEYFEFRSTKFGKCKQYKFFLDEVGTADYEFATVVFHKDRLRGQGFNYPKTFYKYAFKFLTMNILEEIGTAKLYFHEYGGKTSTFAGEFRAYLSTLEAGFFEVKMAEISQIDSDDSVLVQLADMIAGVFKKKLKGHFDLLPTIEPKAISVTDFPYH